MVFLVPGIMTASGWPRDSSRFTYLMCARLSRGSKSVKLLIRGSLITAISTASEEKRAFLSPKETESSEGMSRSR